MDVLRQHREALKMARGKALSGLEAGVCRKVQGTAAQKRYWCVFYPADDLTPLCDGCTAIAWTEIICPWPRSISTQDSIETTVFERRFEVLYTPAQVDEMVRREGAKER